MHFTIVTYFILFQTESVQSNSLFSKETDKQIEGHIKEFLKYANDRLHKKNK